MDIHIRDGQDNYKQPKKELRAFAYPYVGRHTRQVAEKDCIPVPVIPIRNTPGRYKIEWFPKEGKYQFKVCYSNMMIGWKKPFLLKVQDNFSQWKPLWDLGDTVRRVVFGYPPT
eukprot:CAMPEP_0201554794 /NCGR_PEP_ID=MMETSP0173_2-20130828/44244_1 /ASSEMBLY_ACC=CAM_ASM_000268 /TAXON_ID=218659 /ORGANISM="Vexillifera sp., Strain DIVA3 564/2" /LENGTH=113 /DNA_ID=CAMNT_0047966271 /DNA_START=280 /DNA_END=621 /DNA_ORIENTATION=+